MYRYGILQWLVCRYLPIVFNKGTIPLSNDKGIVLVCRSSVASFKDSFFISPISIRMELIFACIFGEIYSGFNNLSTKYSGVAYFKLFDFG